MFSSPFHCKSALLRYWTFDPSDTAILNDDSKRRQNSGTPSSDKTRVDPGSPASDSDRRFKWWRGTGKGKARDKETERVESLKEKRKRIEKRGKKIPVLFFDEAHKLYVLLLDS